MVKKMIGLPPGTTTTSSGDTLVWRVAANLVGNRLAQFRHPRAWSVVREARGAVRPRRRPRCWRACRNQARRSQGARCLVPSLPGRAPWPDTSNAVSVPRRDMRWAKRNSVCIALLIGSSTCGRFAARAFWPGGRRPIQPNRLFYPACGATHHPTRRKSPPGRQAVPQKVIRTNRGFRSLRRSRCG